MSLDLDIPYAFEDLFRPAPYKVYYGGRGSGKSWSVARVLLMFAAERRLRILCAREFQTSIKDSVHRLLSDQISAMGLSRYFHVTDKSITSTIGSEFIFKGLRLNAQEVKSTEGIDIAWVEEAQVVSANSWQVLLPTIRKDGSEVWVTFNPDEATDPTYQMFVAQPIPGSIVRKVSWRDNYYFSEALDRQRRHTLATDMEAYEWIWGGNVRSVSNAVIFRNRVSVETFATPETVERFFYGADWGFANDPTVLVRCYIADECLYVDHESFGYGVEIDRIEEEVFDKVPGSHEWPIKGDSARPETISYLRRRGLFIDAAEKWPNSVEDGIEHLKGFKRIIVHERCKHIAEEFRLYSFKKDKQTGDVLPIIVDAWNHGIDALRYSLDGYIQSRSSAGKLTVWERMFPQ